MKMRNLLVLPVAALAMFGSAALSTPAYADENSHALTVVCNQRGGCTENGSTDGKPDLRVNLWENDRAYWHFRQQRKQHEAQLKMARRAEMPQARQMARPDGQPSYSRQMSYGGARPGARSAIRAATTSRLATSTTSPTSGCTSTSGATTTRATS